MYTNTEYDEMKEKAYEEGIETGKLLGSSEVSKSLERIAEIIEEVDNRAMVADGPVTPTLEEMTQEEISEIWELSKTRLNAT